MKTWKKVPWVAALVYNFITGVAYGEELVSLSSPGSRSESVEFYALCSGAAILLIVALLWFLIFGTRSREESA